MIKRVSSIVLAFSILVSGGAYAETKDVTGTEDIKVDWEYSFIDEKSYLEDLKVNSEDMKALEKLFDEAVKLDKDGKFDTSMEKWNAYNQILANYEDDSYYFNWEIEKDYLEEMDLTETQLAKLEKLFNSANEDEAKWILYKDALEEMLPDEFKSEKITFDQEKEWLKEMKVSSDDMIALEKIFVEATDLDENGKFDDATKKWDTYFDILEKYDFGTTTCIALESNWEEEASWLKDNGIEDDKILKLKALFEASQKDEAKWLQYYEALEELIVDDFKIEPITFDQEKEFLEELEVSKDDVIALEKIFNEAVGLDEKGKYDEATEKWEAYYAILVKYDYNEITEIDYEMNWEEEVSWLKDLGLKNEELSQMKVLFEEANALEKENKYEEAFEKWDDYVEIMDKYFDSFDDLVD